MRPTPVVLATLLLGLTASAGGRTSVEPIADPVAAYPDNYRVLFEDERVRVLDFRLRRGDTEEFHRHPPNVAVFLSDIRIRFRTPDGRDTLREARRGEVAYNAAPVVHSPVNVGDRDAHGILIELKQRAPQAAVADPLTAVTLIHGRPGQEADLKPHLLSLAAPTRTEPGNIAYDLYQSPERPWEFMRFERWANAAALDAHKQTAHLRGSFEKRQREGWTTEILTWRRVAEDLP